MTGLEPGPAVAESSFGEGTSASEAELHGKEIDDVRVETETARLREQLDQLRRENQLSQRVAHGALAAAVVQVVIADSAFMFYGFGNGWAIPAGAVSAWLGATVIQVFAVVLVVTRYLFPGARSSWLMIV